jgi:hypothetical protein
MPLFEDRSASFIVRVWCESGDGGPTSVRAWRGAIEHVPSGQRAFFQELDAVTTFMKPHLVALGIEGPDRFWERMDDAASPSLALPPPPTRTGVAAGRSTTNPRPPRRRR